MNTPKLTPIGEKLKNIEGSLRDYLDIHVKLIYDNDSGDGKYYIAIDPEVERNCTGEGWDAEPKEIKESYISVDIDKIHEVTQALDALMDRVDELGL